MPTKKKSPACRYGRNGFFGICCCDECRSIVVITDEMRMNELQRRDPGLRERIDKDIRAEVLRSRGL